MTEQISRFWRTTWLVWRMGELSSLSDGYVKAAAVEYNHFLDNNKYAKDPLFVNFLEKNLPWQDEFLISLGQSDKIISLVLTSQRLWMLDKENGEHVCLHLKDVAAVTSKPEWSSHTATVVFKNKTEKTFKKLANVPTDDYMRFVLQKNSTAEGWKPKETRSENSEVKKNIDWILDSLTKEHVLSFTFVHWKIVKQKAEGETLKKLSGLVAGVALGGLGGEMIFGGTLLSNPDYVYNGELGIVAVTNEKIYVRHLTVPFQSEEGEISLDHLKLFGQESSSDKGSEKIFNIEQTQISISGNTMHLVSGDESLIVNKSELFIDGGIYPLPTISEVYHHLSRKGALCGEVEFLKKLEKGESPITEEQFAGLEKPDVYVARIYIALINSPKRDELVRNFSCMMPAVQSAIGEQIKKKASVCHGTFKTMIVWISLFVATILGAIFLDDVFRVLCIGGVLITLIGSLVCFFDWKESNWCKGLLDKNQIE